MTRRPGLTPRTTASASRAHSCEHGASASARAAGDEHGDGGPALAARPRAARRDPAAPADGVPDPQAALRPLHPRDGPRGLRHQPGRLRLPRPRDHGELRPRAHHLLRLRRRLDAAHPGRAVHQDRRDPAVAAGQRGPPGRRHHGAARARQHPGLDRHPDAVQPPSRVPADAERRACTTPSPTTWGRSGRRSRRGSGPMPTPTWSACSRRGGATPPGPTTTGPTTTCPG